MVKDILSEVKLQDLIQIIIGATILAVPVGLTEESWQLALTLPMLNALMLMFLSLFFISLFTFYHYHHHHIAAGSHIKEFTKRVLATYLISFLIVALIMGIIEKTPWFTDFSLAFKRILIVTFPSTMSAAVADTIK